MDSRESSLFHRWVYDTVAAIATHKWQHAFGVLAHYEEVHVVMTVIGNKV